MAKKLSLVNGFHNIYTVNLSNNQYDISKFTGGVGKVDKNSVMFVIADTADDNKYILDHRIKYGERFIVTQNNVFAMCGDAEDGNTWRPIYVNDKNVANSNDGNNLKFTDSDYIKPKYKIDNNSVSLYFDIDTTALQQLMNVAVYDSALNFESGTTNVYTGNPTGELNEAAIPQNTVNIEGSFTANAQNDTTVTIKYSGNADRVDWYVTNDQRNEKDPNDSTGKKYVYAEPLQDFFEPSGFPSYNSIKPDKRKYISEDSIVFITCGEKTVDNSSMTLEDKNVFKNPEYRKGSRWIWTHSKMFSCNTWGPIFVKKSDNQLYEITPAQNASIGGRLIIQGKGGITLDNDVDFSSGTYTLTIDGSNLISSGSGGTGGPVTTDKVFVKEDIKIENTKLADLVIADGSFADVKNIIPANMTLQEVLVRLFHGDKKEDWGVQTRTIDWRITNKSISITAKNGSETIANNADVEVGTKLTITGIGEKTAAQSVKITGYSDGGGYKEGETGSIVNASTYTKSFNPTTTNALTNAISGFVRGTENNEYIVTASDSGKNTVTFTNKVDAISQDFETYKVYPVSNMGNIGTNGIEINKALFADKTETATNTFTVNVLLPHFIALSDVVTEFDSASLTDEQKASAITSAKRVEKMLTKTVSETEEKTKSWFDDYGEEGKCKQIIVAVPKSLLKLTNGQYFKVVDAYGDDWYTTNTVMSKSFVNTIMMNGVEYIVWDLRGIAAASDFAVDKFTIKYN